MRQSCGECAHWRITFRHDPPSRYDVGTCTWLPPEPLPELWQNLLTIFHPCDVRGKGADCRQYLPRQEAAAGTSTHTEREEAMTPQELIAEARAEDNWKNPPDWCDLAHRLADALEATLG